MTDELVKGDSKDNTQVKSTGGDDTIESDDRAQAGEATSTCGGGPATALEELGGMQQEALAVEAQIAETEARMREFESQTKYMDAERERKALERLKARRKALSHRHVESYQKVDSEQLQTFAHAKQEEFDERWEKMFSDHNQRTRKMYHALKERHQRELAKLRDELEKKIRVPKYSTHLLGLRQKQRALARCQRYVEAEVIRKSADVLEGKEHEEYKRSCQQQNQVQVDMMLNQQFVDMNALRQKTKLERKVMMEDRSKEQKQLDYRLRNSMMEMTRMHTKQTLVAEGKLFDTGFYTQRGAARSSKPLAAGSTLSSSEQNAPWTATAAKASESSSTGKSGGDRRAAPELGEPSPVPLSARQGGLPPVKSFQRVQKKSPQTRAGVRPKPHEKLTTKEEMYRQKKVTPRTQTNRGTVGTGKEQRVPGRRRQEFSIRKLARERVKGRA